MLIRQIFPAANNELVPDDANNGYAVGTNPQNYHYYFWGIDHTNNQTGNRNFMMVNGHGGINYMEGNRKRITQHRLLFFCMGDELKRLCSLWQIAI